MSKSFLIFFIIIVADIILDFGKWAIGRYTEVTPIISIIILILGSGIIAIISRYVSEIKEIKKFISYLHHGSICWVRKDMKDNHWDSMICTDCVDFEIRDPKPNKCLISAEIHKLCLKHCLVLSVWECPKFKNIRIKIKAKEDNIWCTEQVKKLCNYENCNEACLHYKEV